VLKGHLALPARTDTPRPAVLVVHEWWGRGAHSDKSAEDLAQLGYVGFAVDMYGDGRSTTDPKQAGEWSGEVKKDPALGMRRFRAALDYVRSLPDVDSSRVAAIGYCFGGTVCLEAAWAGTDLRGIVSFHGGLTMPKAEQVPGVKASILVCHGAEDPFVSKETVDAFVKSMRDGKFDWEFAEYAGAVHSFTNPASDGSFNPGAKYHPVAAARSWSLMESFLAERLR
jgi:dienelactone hydrolase